MSAEYEDDWVILCKRTNDPKLAWLEKRLDEQRIEHKRQGGSYHAEHILLIHRRDERWANELLLWPAPPRLRRWYKMIDDIPDDHKMFQENK